MGTQDNLNERVDKEEDRDNPNIKNNAGEKHESMEEDESIDEITIRDNGRSNVSGTHGILKSSQLSDANERNEIQPLSSFQSFPYARGNLDMMEGNNTTSRISTLISQTNTKGNRRVSFAPDVTLHSFDFVPEKEPALREPRRRLHEHIVTSTQNESADERSSPGSSQMDLTDPFVSKNFQLVKTGTENYTPVFTQEDSMDITQMFSKGPATEGDKTMDFTKVHHSPLEYADKTMDFTKVHDSIMEKSDNNGTMEFTQVNSIEQETQEKSSRLPSPPLPSNIEKYPNKINEEGPIDSKRQKRTENIDEASPPGIIENKQLDNLVHKIEEKAEEEEEDMELTVNERMSPIKITPNPDFSKPSLPKATTSYSLETFLEETGVTFLLDTDIIEEYKSPIRFEMITITQTKRLRINRIYSALYIQSPILEMYSFICKELLRKISQSKVQFEDLKKQISTSNPPPLLFIEYFNSGDAIKQSMNNQIHLVHRYSKLEAKKLWYQWRIQHLTGIKTVLIENLQILNDELNKLKSKLEMIQQIKFRAQRLQDSIRREIKVLKEIPPNVHKTETTLSAKLRLEALKQEFLAFKINPNDSESLTDKLQKLNKSIAEINSNLTTIKREIAEVRYESSLNRKKPYKKYAINKLKATLDILGDISGVSFTRLEGSELSCKINSFDPFIEVTILLQKPLEKCYPVIRVEGSYKRYDFFTSFFDIFFEFLSNNSKIKSSNNYLTNCYIGIQESIPLIKQYLFLQMLFPVQVTKKDDRENISLQFEDSDIKSKNTVIYELSMKEFFVVVTNSKSIFTLTGSVSGVSDAPLNDLSTRLFKKAAKVLPWLGQQRCKIIYKEI